jgi:hypothetical protein
MTKASLSMGMPCLSQSMRTESLSGGGVHHIDSRHLSHRSGRFELTVQEPKRTATLQVTRPISSSTLAAFDRKNRAKAYDMTHSQSGVIVWVFADNFEELT